VRNSGKLCYQKVEHKRATVTRARRENLGFN